MIETNNLYYASFLLNEGLEITNVRLGWDEKFGQTVIFNFTDHDPAVERGLERSYREETAVTNIRKYIDALVRVRDIVYRVTNNTRTKTDRTKGKSNDKARDRRIKIKN